MLIGAQVSSAGGPAKAVGRGDAMGAEAIQVFTQSPRAWRPQPVTDDQAALTAAAMSTADFVRAIYCHGTYLVNLASPDDELWERSRACFESNLDAASRLCSAGLIFHPGSHRGSGLDGAIDRIAEGVASAASAVVSSSGKGAHVAPLLFENTAGAGDTVGRCFEDLAALIEATASRLTAAERTRVAFGVCIDSQHLWASGVDYSTVPRADAVVRELDATVGLARVRAIHLNDSTVPFGAGRDRHANLGEGTVGEEGLAALLGHPGLQEVAVLLEVPGPDGKGPEAADVVAARRVHHHGLEMRS